jgi:hypothetical protein
LRKITIEIKMTTIPGMSITDKKKLFGSLQESDITITEADKAIRAKPIVVKRLAHLLWIRTKTDDNEKGTRSIPTAITIDI